jgi:hypothetical protein
MLGHPTYSNYITKVKMVPVEIYSDPLRRYKREVEARCLECGAMTGRTELRVTRTDLKYFEFSLNMTGTGLKTEDVFQ